MTDALEAEMAMELIFDASVDIEEHLKGLSGESSTDMDDIDLSLDQFCKLYQRVINSGHQKNPLHQPILSKTKQGNTSVLS
jgi:hypothetical protein